ncbi:MAG TPA: 4-(cytidine 5'-diphospho)-2-C-methyl-D-erythritol kinase [Flavisolibacter sp.]
MVVFPNCKINLGLHILRKRPDGFHDLATVFYPLHLHDGLEVIRQQNGEHTTLSVTGTKLDIDPSQNICVKAWQLLRDDFPGLPPVKMNLNKVIPTGAGLGGGSADGAFTLMLLNRKFHLQLNDDQLARYALELGSDCPFFIRNQPAYATGRGEIMEAVQTDLSAFRILLVHPGIHIGTAWAFSQVTPAENRPDLRVMMANDVSMWKGMLTNDFQQPVIAKYPEIGNVIDSMYEAGAVYAAMTGSGSAVFGLFTPDRAPALSWPQHYFTRLI